MMFTRSFILALFSGPLLALAQSNPFKVSAGFSATAGKPVTLQWTPTTSGTVSLVLRSGNSNNLAAGTPIMSNIPNSGSFTWTPEASIAPGSDYTVEIIDDADTQATNFTPQFTLSNPNYVATTSSQSASTSTASSSASTSSSTSVSSTSSSTSSSSQSTITTSMSSSRTSSHSSTSQSTSSTASSSTTSPSHNAAPRATAMAGMLGVVALGALAL